MLSLIIDKVEHFYMLIGYFCAYIMYDLTILVSASFFRLQYLFLLVNKCSLYNKMICQILHNLVFAGWLSQ